MPATMTDPTPKAFDFGETERAPAAPSNASGTPRAFSFDDEQTAPHPPSRPAVAVLFDSDDHPAVRDAMSLVRSGHPALFATAEQRLAALFRRILPVQVSLAAQWGDEPLREQAAQLQPVAELVRAFAQMAVPAQLEAALEQARPASGIIGKLLRRTATLDEHQRILATSHVRLLQFVADSQAAARTLEASARELALHGAVLGVVAQLASGADELLRDVIGQRRSLIQQALRQAELSILQLRQVERQAAELAGQVASFLHVTLPALELARREAGR